MKIATLWQEYKEKFPFKLKIIRKGYFRILLEDEAYFVGQYFNMKLTKLDKENIKVGFPISSEKRWFGELEKKNIGYVLIEKNKDGNYSLIKTQDGSYYNKLFQINIEDFELTKKRIIGLDSIGLEEKITPNFLLKDKVEQIYILFSQRLLRMPKIERWYFREKLEKMFMDLLEAVYKFMYNISDRKIQVKIIFDTSMILREFTRFLYTIGKIKNDNVYMDMGGRRIEILKISKTLYNKYGATSP